MILISMKANLTRKTIIALITTFFIALILFIGIIELQSLREKEIASESSGVQNLPVINHPRISPSSDKTPHEIISKDPYIDPSLAYLLDKLIRPFYEARITGNQERAFSYLEKSPYQEKKDYYFEWMEKEGWEFIRTSFRNFEVKFIGKSKQNGVKALVRIQFSEDKFQDEILSIDDSLRPSFYITNIMYQKDGYRVVRYKDAPYLVLKEARDPTGQQPKIVLATPFFIDFCSGAYGEDGCNIFSESNEGLNQVLTASDVLTLKFNNGNLLIKKGYGEGGSGFESIEALNLITKKLTTLISSEDGGAAKIPPNLMAEGSCAGGLDSYEKNGHQLAFVAFCSKDAAELKGYILGFDGKILYKQTLTDEQRKQVEKLANWNLAFNVDLEKNALNDDQFEFTFINIPYTISFSDGKLRQHQ